MDERMFEFMQETTRTLGRIEAKVDNTVSHVGAVSRKADNIRDELREHAQDDGAHGMGGERRATISVREWIAWAMGGAGLALALVKWRG